MHLRTRAKSPSAPIAAEREKLSPRIATEIMTDIRRRGWPVGEVLGTEAELMARFRVSRATMLEAIRQVERQGAATMRRGANGGLTVTAPASATIRRSLSTYLELSDVSLSEQFEAWRIIEVYAVGVAARKINAEGIAELRRLVAAIDEAEGNFEFLKRCMAVRIAVAERTANPAIALFLRVLVRVLSHALESAVAAEISAESRQSRAYLGELVEAIASGDVALAQGIAHLNLGLREGSARRKSGGSRPPPATDEPPQKLAEIVALRIRDDIAAMGWPEGAKLGDEGGLLQRYGVSRWILRQAFRTLEVHEIVRTKRGQRGGLMVGRPDPKHTVNAAVAYLSFTGYTLEDVSDVWRAVIENAVQMAAEHVPADPGPLMAAVEAEEAAESLADVRGAATGFYGEITRLCGNRVIALFLDILLGFLRTYETRPDRLWVMERMRVYHRRIAEALVAGNGGLARRTMAEYEAQVRPAYSGRPTGGHMPPPAPESAPVRSEGPQVAGPAQSRRRGAGTESQ